MTNYFHDIVGERFHSFWCATQADKLKNQYYIVSLCHPMNKLTLTSPNISTKSCEPLPRAKWYRISWSISSKCGFFSLTVPLKYLKKSQYSQQVIHFNRKNVIIFWNFFNLESSIFHCSSILNLFHEILFELKK